jgi:hypothetical protein
MIILLNLLTGALVIAGLATAYFAYTSEGNKRVTNSILAILFTAIAFGLSVGVSYTPKGTVPELSNPSFEPSESETQDRLKAPKTDHEAVLEEKLDWKDTVKESKENDHS